MLAGCYAIVRLADLACYLVAARYLRQLLTAVPVAAASGLLVAGGALGPPYQTGLWALAHGLESPTRASQ